MENATKKLKRDEQKGGESEEMDAHAAQVEGEYYAVPVPVLN